MDNRLKPENTPLLVTAAVIISEEMVLITRRPINKPHGGLWEFPGGKIEPGESPPVALTRELGEELNVAIVVGDILDVLYHQYDTGTVLILAYYCKITQGVPQNIEVAEHRWVHISELHNYNLLPADKPLIEKLQNKP